MRILAMLHLYAPQHNAGAETTAHQLLKKLVECGHQVVVQLSMLHPMYVTGPYTYEGVNVYPYVDQADPLRWLEHSAGKPDLIIAHLSNTLRASILGKMHGIPVITLCHNTHGKTKADLRWKTDLVVYNTQWMKKDIEDWWVLTQESEPPPGIVINPVVFPELYKITPPTAAKGCITLVNLFEDKGASLFYRLAAKFPKLKFLGVAGAYGKQDIRKDIPNVEIIPHVASHKMASEVYARTRVLLIPSVYESYGRVGVEAACSGIPAIYHPTEGLTEALGAEGTAADRDNLSAWVAALAGLTTSKGWAEASGRARSLAARLTPTEDLERWVGVVERFARSPALV